MRGDDPGGQGPQPGVEIELDPEVIERKRAERRYALNVVEIPSYRAVAYLVLLLNGLLLSGGFGLTVGDVSAADVD